MAKQDMVVEDWPEGSHDRAKQRVFYAPADLSLAEHPEPFLAWLWAIRKSMFVESTRRHRPRRTRLDRAVQRALYSLDRVSNFDLDAMLLVLAEFSRVRGRSKMSMHLEDRNWNPGIRDALKQLGFYEHLNVRNPAGDLALVATPSGWIVHPFLSGTRLDPVRLSQALTAIATTAGLNHRQLARLHEAMTEGINNVVARVENTPVTVDEWHRQRAVVLAADLQDPVALGFATLFLNRTNRSGVIRSGGLIGGLDQTGPYLLDCRFNRDALMARVARIGRYRSRIHLTRLDAADFLSGAHCPQDAFAYLDPPYFQKGRGLYTSFYTPAGHAALAHSVGAMTVPWILTYDDVPEIRALWRHRRQFQIALGYSAQIKRKATELLIAGPGVKIPPSIRDGLVNRAR